MKEMARDLKYTRNIGIAAHIDAGKTTTTERILFYTGKTTKLVRCTMVLQQWTGWRKSRNVVLQLLLLLQLVIGIFHRQGNFQNNYHFNIIDTPGHVDFTVEVNRSLRVLDGLVFLFSAVDGVEPQSETNWRLADQYKVTTYWIR